MQKQALLLGGGGNIGCYTYLELLKMGWKVDVVDRLPFPSYNQNLRWIQAEISDELLQRLLSKTHYDTVIDYGHYPDTEVFKAKADNFLSKTDQYIFISSYRVYGNTTLPIREDNAQLLETCKDDAYFLEHEDYAIPKSRNECYLRSCGRKNWTIVRPVISFSHFRLEMIAISTPVFFLRALEGKKSILPEGARYLHAGYSWAGNVGKQLAHLCGNGQALGEDFTLSSGELITWDEVAQLYHEFFGAEFVWVSDEDFLKVSMKDFYMAWCGLYRDRLFDRSMDVSKVMRVTGLTAKDMVSTRDALIEELELIAHRPDLMERFHQSRDMKIDRQIDAYLEYKKL